MRPGRGRRGSGIPELTEALNKSGVEFLIADLDTALTLVDVADSSGIAEVRQRRYRSALRAYNSVVRLLRRVRPDAEQQGRIDLKLAAIRERLNAVRGQY